FCAGDCGVSAAEEKISWPAAPYFSLLAPKKSMQKKRHPFDRPFGYPRLRKFAAAGQELAALKQPAPYSRIKLLSLGSIKMGFVRSKNRLFAMRIAGFFPMGNVFDERSAY
ncbi:MAG: hypothetical protein GY850_38275, partial [bacterium]|nr:hypothetical protein [bacterium]